MFAALMLAGLKAFCVDPVVATNAPQIKPPPPTPFAVVDTGSNHRKWQREVFEKAPDGRIVSRIHQYTELAAGMNYKNAQGQWVESKETIEAFPQGAVATHGQYQVIFANNLNSAGAIDMQTPDKKRLRSNILGLAYYDSALKRVVLVAEVKDSYGALVGNNQVLYEDAFDGVRADVHYTYKRGGFEQDVILREQPPTPESLGLSSASTHLEVFTEFLNPPAEKITLDKDNSGKVVDQNISWGVTQIGRGRAFDLSEDKASAGVAVEKKYVVVNGRKILIEMVPLKSVTKSLQRLPEQSSIGKKRVGMLAKSDEQIMPVARTKEIQMKPMKLAMTKPATKGYVLDYIAINVSQTDFTFQGDQTYYISGDINFSGTTTLEGGTVIKFETNNPCSVNVLETVTCLTGPYRPAIFTSATDGTVGEPVGGSSAPCYGTLFLHIQNDWSEDMQYFDVYDDNWNNVGSTTVASADSDDISFIAGLGQHYYVDAYDTDWNWHGGDIWPLLENGTFTIASDGSSSYSESGDDLCTPSVAAPGGVGLILAGGDLHDVRFKNLRLAINSLGSYTIRDAQFVGCGTAFKTEACSLYAGNILLSGVDIAFAGHDFSATAENVTHDQGIHVTDNPYGDTSYLTLKNSLLTGVTDYGTISVSTDHVTKLASNAGIYQAVGAASYYLADGSPYRNAATASGLDSGLVADLRKKTTYPPMAYTSSSFTTAQTFSPQAQRDTDTLDLGYHYDPLDYAFGGCSSTADLTFSAGTSVAWFGGSSGIGLGNNIKASFNGTAASPCYFVRYCMAQESSSGNWEDTSSLGGIVNGGSYDPENPAILEANFTRFYHSCADPGCFRDGGSGEPLKITAQNCELLGNFGGYNMMGNFTNCLMNRVGFWQGTSSSEPYEKFKNCTFHGGYFYVVHWESGAPYWFSSARNCVFDGTVISIDDPFGSDTTYADYDYNAFVTGASQPYPEGAHNQVVSSFNWQSSWLGDFYLPTGSALIDTGSTNANLLGLYHFTTQTDQTKETNTVVDIGYHYVATDSYGNPLDTDGDGIPDYQEDGNGNGAVNSGETDWQSGSDRGLRVLITRPRSNSQIP